MKDKNIKFLLKSFKEVNCESCYYGPYTDENENCYRCEESNWRISEEFAEKIVVEFNKGLKE